MANNRIQVKRTSTAGRQPNTTNSSNSQYIAAGEFALNMTDQILYTSDGTNLITVGANTVNHNVTGNLTVKAIVANNSLGTANQVLTSNGTGVYWSTVSGGGGGSALPARQLYTANGSVNTFTVTGGYYANNLDVYLNGVKLVNGTDVNTASGSTFTILGSNPPNNAVIEVVGTSALTTTGVSTVVNQQITANGSANSFAITNGYIANSIAVFLNGVKQIPGVDVITTSGSNVNFVSTPANNDVIDVYGYQTSVSYVANTIVVGNTNIGLNSITSNGTANSYFMGSVGIGTSTPQSSLSMAGGGITIVQDGDYFGGGAYYGGSPSNWRNSVSSEGGWAIRNTGGYLTFFTGSNPGTAGSVISDMAERVRIDNSGNVGIGTSSPSAKLDVQGNGTIARYLGNSGTYQGFAVQSTSANSSNYNGIFYDARNESGAAVANFLADINTDGSSAWAWATQPAGTRTDRRVERMRIDSSGNVGIGTNSPAYKLDVNGTVRGRGDVYLGFVSGSQAGVWWSQSYYAVPAFQGLTSAGNVGDIVMQPGGGNLLVGTTTSGVARLAVVGSYIGVGSSTYTSGADNVKISSSSSNFSRSSTAATAQIYFENPNGTVGQIQTSGTSTSYLTSSDYRLKTNVTPLTTAQSGPIIDALKPSQFTWTNDNTPDVGFIAHEMQAVIPRAVTGEKDAVDAEGKPVYQQVAVSSPEIIAYLVAEIQSLRARLKAANIA